MKIPKSHPRYESLVGRKRIEEGVEEGIVAVAGLVAHGRGEAFDYLLDEKTTAEAKRAIEAATAVLLLAEHPVISVNGNVAVLCPKELILLSRELNAPLEVNVFYPPKKRRMLIAKHLKKFSAKRVLGTNPTKRIAGLDSDRALVDRDGIWKADAVLVSLEDGDRTEALRKNRKKVIAIDLNPLSRTAQKADITIVDNVVRVIPLIWKEIKRLRKKRKNELRKIVKRFNNKKNLRKTINYIKKQI